jgi:predicted RNase H-like HicB family nuclease
MKTSDALDQRDWIIVEKASGFISRGLTREEVSWNIKQPAALIEAVIALKLTYETADKIVIGEWRRK